MVILMVVMGAVFGLLFLLNSILRAAQGREKVSFFETLLAFLAFIFPVLALVNNSSSPQPLPLVNMASIGLGVIVVLVSLITFFIERRKPGRPLAQRRGVLGIGLGILLAVATFIVPIATKLPSAAKTPAPEVNAAANASNVNVAQVASPVATDPVALEPTNTPDAAMLRLSATPTRLASPSPTPTNTPFIIATTTPVTATDANSSAGSAAQISDCLAVVRQNVNLRSGPGKDYELLVTIPFSTTLNVSAKTKAADWWYVNYNNQSGWVSGDYVNIGASCATLPVKAG